MLDRLSPHEDTSSSWLSDLLWLSVGIGVLFFIFLGQRPLLVPDEGRYAEIAREMVTRSDFVTPYLNGIKYFEKPPFFYWLGAAAIKLGGTNLWVIRSINAVVGLLGCLTTYAITRKFFDRATGLISAIILATSMLYFVMSHMVSLDLPVTVFISCCLYTFLLAAQDNNKRLTRIWLYLSAIFAAGAVLTKGLIGVVFPGLIALTWIALTRKWSLLRRLPILSALFIFLIVATPWHYLVNHYNPEFFHFYFIEQHILRYTNKEIGHYQPVWFFIPVLLIGFFPWIAFLPQAITRCLSRIRREHQVEGFMLCWALIVFVFFSFSKSKLIPYILPVVPPLAIITSTYLSKLRVSVGLKLGYGIFAISSVLIACALWQVSSKVPFPDRENALLFLRIASSILVIGSMASMLFSFRRPSLAFVAASITTSLFLITSYYSVPFIDSRTVRPLAKTLKTYIKPQDEVITYNQYYQDLPFYLQRRVTILNWKNELSYGMAHQNTKNWMIDDQEFSRRWLSNKRVFTIMSKDEYRGFSKKYPTEKIFIIDETGTNLLVTNSPLAISPS